MRVGVAKARALQSSVVESPSIALWVAADWGFIPYAQVATRVLHVSAIMLLASPCHSHRPFLILS